LAGGGRTAAVRKKTSGIAVLFELKGRREIEATAARALKASGDGSEADDGLVAWQLVKSREA
jgi:hypothetical protein